VTRSLRATPRSEALLHTRSSQGVFSSSEVVVVRAHSILRGTFLQHDACRPLRQPTSQTRSSGSFMSACLEIRRQLGG
jgi:hypothetical protein